MPAIITEHRWLRRYNAGAALDPGFSVWTAREPEGFPNVLRQAFSFLRRHGGGRYTANSLMKLLQAADRLDEAMTGGFNVLATDIPTVIVGEMPFNYDEDTEVKSGGLVSVAVILPDGRMMLAVNNNLRRQKLGLATFRFATAYANPYPVVWIHQANLDGAAFALTLGLQPREVSTRGAVAWCETSGRQQEDEMASECTDDYDYEAVANGGRHPRRTPRGEMSRAERQALDSLSRLPALTFRETEAPLYDDYDEDR